MKEGTRGRSGLLRRYPALAFVVAAGALALLLPSALTVPQSGPSTLAEFAPVPGTGEGRSDVSEFGSAQSGGLGFGSGRGGAGGGLPDQIGTPKQGKSRLKRCVGNPPRQTEDLLSPPCVAFFDGDNFGSTWRGVTKDEVIAVLYAVGDPAGKIVDYTKPNSPDDTPVDTAGRAYWRYFNDRYQTYGRVVRLYGFHGSSTNPDGGQTVRNEVTSIDDGLRPFAITGRTTTAGILPLVTESGRRGIVTASYAAYDRSAYLQFAPLIFSFAPDLQDEAALIASYGCRKLAGLPAKHSGDVLDKSKRRVFGILYLDAPGHATYPRLREITRNEFSKQCSELVHEAAYSGQKPESLGTSLSTLRGNGVTTVIPMGAEGDPLILTNSAASMGWYPEWFVPGATDGNGIDDSSRGRLYNQAEWRNAFGVSFDYRRGAIPQQAWSIAFKEGCPNCEVPQEEVAAIYDSLTMLFYGVQAAGPRLTPQTIDKGMHAIPQRGSANPYKPAAYFAPGNYSYIKDAMEIWWDPVEPRPGDGRPGCYRLPNDGRRFRKGEWPEGDNDVFKSGPCQGPSGSV